MSEEQKSNEVKLFEEIILMVKYGIFFPIFWYACNIRK